MKKVIRQVLLLLLVAVMTLSTLPFAGAVSAKSVNKSTVYRYLTNTLGLNRAAACGIMANIEKESDFDPTEIYLDSNGLLSGGLCQWNGVRFTSLKNFCKKNGYSYLSIAGQMNYLKNELKNRYTGVLSHMKNVSNNASGAYDAGHYWCYYFEVPASRSSKSVTRGNLAKSYFSSYQPVASLSQPKAKTNATNGVVNLLSTLKVSWSSSGKTATGYVVSIAKYKKNAYDWKQATTQYVTSTSTTFSAYELGTGKYAVKVTAQGIGETKDSAVVKFQIKCVDHLYSAKVTKAATATKNGSRLYTCQYCKSTRTQTITSGALKAKTLAQPAKVTAKKSGNVTKVTYSKVSGANGYIIYALSGSQWVKLATMPASLLSASFVDMPKGTIIAVVAFKTQGAKTIKSATTDTSVK